MAVPEFATQASISSKNDFKVRVAIDFGTDGVALAYAFGEADQVTAHAEWACKKYSPRFKPKTIILLDDEGEAIGFGKDAKHTYMATYKMKDKWMLFERFKMALYDDSAPDIIADDDDEKQRDPNTKRKIAIKDTLTATNGKTVKASVVFIAAFKHLQTQAKDYLKRNKVTKKLFRKLKPCNYQWIITVPAIWNDEAKNRMRQWAIDAGLVDPDIEDQCMIVYEPDCASLSIQYQINQNKSQIHACAITDDPESDDEKENGIGYEATFEKGEKYILVDAGGGTVDIACHEILSQNDEYGIKEILAPSGGPWGSCYIDDQFIKLLKEMFSNEWIDEFKDEKPNIYTELLDNFQNAKATFYQKDEYYHNVRVPFDFIGFIQDKLEEDNGSDNDDVDIEDVVSFCKVFGQSNLVKLSDEYLSITKDGWQVMFNHVMIPTINHVKKLLAEPKLMRNCKYLCLAGGLSTSSYFQAKMREEFGLKSKYKLALIIPQRPILSVVEGAAYFGITQNYIKARVLRYTYGEIMSNSEALAKKTNVPSDHIEKHKYFDKSDNMWWVRDCFQVIARKGDEIYTGQITKSQGNRSNAEQKIVATRIMVSAMEDPKVKANGTQLGVIKTELDKDDMSITLEFHFYSTVIKAVVYSDKTPDKKQTCYITNYK